MNGHSCAVALVCGSLFAGGVFFALAWKSTSPDKADQFPYCYVFPGKGIAGGGGTQEPQEFQHLRVCYKNPINFRGYAGGGGTIGKQQEGKTP